jgi:hypothetical protein
MSTIVADYVHWVITFLCFSEKWSVKLQDTPSTFYRQQNTLWFQNQGVNTLWIKKLSEALQMHRTRTDRNSPPGRNYPDRL